jgi:ADP-L-glycero-D-manno-heptose 6-epimerase
MIILTGGAGFIGSAMLWELNRAGRDDVLVVDDLESASSGKWKNISGLRYADIMGIEEFSSLLESNRLGKVEAVIHMGAISATTEEDADLLLRRNFHYSKSVARFCMQSGARLVYASSAATYGDGALGYCDDEETMHRLRPLNMYGYSKQLFDLWAQRNGVLHKAAGLKFFNVYGPNEYHKEDMTSVVYKAFQQVRATGRVKLFKSYRPDYADGEQLRDFVYVKDCTAVMQWLLENPGIGGVFNLGTGAARSFRQLVTATFEAMGLKPDIEFIPMPEKLRDKYQYYTQADMQKLKAYGCTVEMTPLKEGVRDYVQHYLQQENPYFEAADA